jgi:hypothetical protein
MDLHGLYRDNFTLPLLETGWDCHQSLVKLAKHNRVQLIWMPGHESIEGNWELNVCSYDLNQIVSFQQELPKRLSGTGKTETIKNTVSPSED